MKKRIIFITTVTYIVLITALSVIKFSDHQVPTCIDNFNSIANLDKIVHLCFYITLNFLLQTLFAVKYAVERLSSMLIISISAILYSVAIEFVQLQVGRECSVYDVIANMIGVTIGLVIFKLPKVNRALIAFFE